MRKETQQDRVKQTLRHFTKRQTSLIRAAKFALGSTVGFLDTEIVLTLGTYLLYDKISAPSHASSSPVFWALNIIAFIIGVSVAFFVNESLLVQDGSQEFDYDPKSLLERLGKFQLVFLTGNFVMIGVQMVLLREISFPPVAGNIVGAVISFPISYFFSMYFVWHLLKIGRNNLNSAGMSAKERYEKLFSHLISSQIETEPRRISTLNGDYIAIIQNYRFDIFSKGRKKPLSIFR
jgi:putative flippase GtrA